MPPEKADAPPPSHPLPSSSSDPRPSTSSKAPSLSMSISSSASSPEPVPASSVAADPEKNAAKAVLSDAGPGADPGAGVTRVLSTASSRRRNPVIVPRACRRGLLARFTIVAEVEDPVEYVDRTKWFLTFVVALAGAVSPMGSSIFYPALPGLSASLGSTPTVTNLAIAMYMIAMSIFPLWWASFSERFGRRSILIVSFSMFVVFSTLSAVSTNIAMLIVSRLFSGGASASVYVVGAGVLSDIWEVRERGRALGIFYLGPLMGPLLAPIIGGLLAQAFGWQSTMWFLTAYGGLLLVVMTIFLPETISRARLPPRRLPADTAVEADDAAETATLPRPGSASDGRRLTRMTTAASAVSVHTRRVARVLRQVFIDPLGVLLMLRFPAVALTVIWGALTFGALFVVNISVQQTFSNPPYSFQTLIVGLMYIPPSIGYVLASVLGGRWIDRIMAREAEKQGRVDEKGKLIYLPEDRVGENAWLAGTMYPLAMIAYGWTVDKGLHWAVPSVFNVMFGFGSMLVFSVSTTALTEYVPKRSASGVAINNFVRNIMSCIGAIVSNPVIDAIGNGWVFTIVGIAMLIVSFTCIISLKHFGPQWRKKMDAALQNS